MTPHHQYYKRRFVPLVLLFLLTFILNAATTFAATGTEVISPGQPEYMQGDMVYIYGNGFTPNQQVMVQVIRVDGSIVTGNGTETPGSDIITADPYGTFIYPYLLDGGTSAQYYGTLTVNAIDTSNMVTILASTTFLDNPNVGLQGCSREKGDCTQSATPLTGWADGTNPMNGWTSGEVKGWYELEDVPYRLRINPRQSSDAKTYYFIVEHDNLKNGVTGVDSASEFYVGAGPDMSGYTQGVLTKNCVMQAYRLTGDVPTTSKPCIVTGPTLSGIDDDGDGRIDEDSADGINNDGDGKVDEDPSSNASSGVRRIQYTVAVLFTSSDVGNNKKWAIYWKAHLASGSSNYPGSSLHAQTSLGGNQDVPIQSVLAVPQADLLITKTDSPDPVTKGGTLTYSITVHNNGPGTAKGVVVTDALPSSVTYISASPSQGSCSGSSTVTCSLGNISNGDGVTINIDVTPNTAGSISNTASVTSTSTDPNLANNTATATTTVNLPAQYADLSILKTASPDPSVNAGGLLTYTLTVHNYGPDTATNVTVSDTLPAGVSNVNASGTGWSCIISGYAVTCSNPSLANGASSIITITVTAPLSGCGLTNTASVTASQSDTNSSNNTSSVTTTVNPVADLSIVKIDTPDPVTAAGILTYTLTVTNSGPSAATSVTVSDTLPTGTVYSAASGTGWSCSQVSGVVTCTRASVSVGTALPITISVKAPNEGGSITNTASVSSSVFDSNTGNNSSSASTVVNASADVSITKADSPHIAVIGENLTYTLTVKNNGPSTATGVTVTDTLPPGLTFVSVTPGQGTCTGTGSISCNLGTLANTVQTIVTIVVTPTAAASLSNIANVSSSTPDSKTSNNSSSVTTTVNSFGAATKLVITSVAQTVGAGSASGVVTVQAQDAYNNPVTSSSAVVNLLSTFGTMKFDTSAGGAFTGTVTSITLSGGIGSFYFKDTVPGTPMLTVSSAGLSSASQTETITAGAATKLVITSIAQSVGAGSASGVVTVQAQDAYNNPVTTSTASVNLSSASGSMKFDTSAGGAFSGAITSITLSGGTGSFYFKDTTAGNPVITASSTGLAQDNQTETITVGAAAKLVIKSTAQTVGAGSASGVVTVQAQDAYNNPVTTSTASVSLSTTSGTMKFDTSSAGAFDGTVTSITLSGGTGSFYFKDTVPGSPVITVSSTGLTQDNQTETVTAGAVSTLAITSLAQTVTAGSASGVVTVQLQDVYGNPVTTSSAVVDLTSSSGTMKFDTSAGGLFNGSVTSVTLSGGNGSFYFKDTTAGSPVITVSSAGLTSASQTETVTVGAVSKLAITSLTQTVVAGYASGAVTVQAQDAYGNPVTTSTALVSLSSSSGSMKFDTSAGGAFSGAITSITLSGGTGTFYFEDSTAGSPTITVSSAGLVLASQSVTVTAGAATKLVIKSGAQTIGAGGVSGVVTVQAQDVYNNPVSSSATVTLSSASGTMKFDISSGGAFNGSVTSITLSGGNGSFFFKDTTAGSPAITVSSTGLTQDSQTETITAGAVNKLAIISIPQIVTAGSASGAVTIQAQDAYGNLVTTSSASVSLSSSSGSMKFDTSAGGAFSGTITTVTLSGGTGSFYFKSTVPGTPLITISSGSLTSASQTETITGGTASKLVYTTSAQTVSAGTASGIVTIQTQDAYNNPVSSSAVVSLSSPSSTMKFDTVIGGAFNGTITTVTLSGGTGSFYFRDTTAGSPVITSASTGLTYANQTETITAGPATRVEFTSIAQVVSAGAVSGVVTIQAQDAYGNPVFSSVSVSLVSTSGTMRFDTSAGGAFDGSLTTITLAGGIGSFYFIDTAGGNPTITVSSAGLLSGSQTETIGTSSVDLSVTNIDSPDPVALVGDNVTYTITVTNHGPNTATGVSITDTLGSSVTLVSATPSQGTCTGTTCAIGTLANGYGATVTVIVTTSPPAGMIGNTATVTGNEPDPNMTNNSILQTTNVGDVSRLSNISTRAQIGTGLEVLNGGFVIGGSTTKTFLIRARGPSLSGAPFNYSGTLANPFLKVYSFSAKAYIAQNDNWQTTDPLCANSGYVCGTPAQITATGKDPCQPNPGQTVAPNGCSNEAAMLITLPPGNYSAIVSGVNSGTGIGIVEVFDTDGSTLPKLVNISARAKVLTGVAVENGGFVISGGTGNKTVLIRARGPSLSGAPYNYSGTLANPTVRLYSFAKKAYIAQNDNWQDTNDSLCATSGFVCGTPAQITATGKDPCQPNPGQTVAPNGCSNESSILITLPPGNYSAIVSGMNSGTGLGIVEIFEITQ